MLQWESKNYRIFCVCVCVCVCGVCVCVLVGLVIQQAKSMRCVILTSAACPALPYFSTLPYKKTGFSVGKNYLT